MTWYQASPCQCVYDPDAMSALVSSKATLPQTIVVPEATIVAVSMSAMLLANEPVLTLHESIIWADPTVE